MSALGEQEIERIAVGLQAWLQDWIIGLGLCPFARGPAAQGLVRVAVSTSTDLNDLAADLMIEADRLMDPARSEETTLLAVPAALADWEDFLDAIALFDELLQQDGLVQVVGFHPSYRFADERGENDPANRVNRSPVPLLHLLRVDRVAAATRSIDAMSISAQNAELLRSGRPEIERIALQLKIR